MNFETFDDFDSSEKNFSSENETPFQYRENQSDDDATLEWLRNDVEAKLRKADSRIRTYRKYWAYYKGLYWTQGKNRNDDDMDSQQIKPKLKVNFIFEMVESRISQVTENKIAIAMIPQNGEEQADKNNAKACKLLTDSWSEQYDMDLIQEEAERIKAITGTVFQYGEWDKDKGPMHPLLEQTGGEFPIIGAVGNKKHKGPVRIGDAQLKNYQPDRILLELDKEEFSECDEFTKIDYIHKAKLKAMYPDSKIDWENCANDEWRYDENTMEVYKSPNVLRVYTYVHKKTQELPEGCMIVFVDDGILEKKGNPLKSGDLPLTVDYDIKIKGEVYGRSFISNIEQMQNLYNNIRSGIGRDIAVGSMPKWAVPKGSVKISALNNEFTIMEYSGAKAPEIIHNPPISDKLLGMEDKLEKQIAQHSSVFDISRGQVPTGVTANSALRFLDEQEDRRVAPLKKRRRSRILNAYRLLIQLMAIGYQAEDGRMARVLGQRNQYLIKSIKNADFSKIYDVRLQSSSSLPDTKTGKISTIVDINMSTQTDPVFGKEQIIQMLDLGNDEAFISQATVAVDAAGEILEKIFNGEEVPEPQIYDNNIVHWNIFYKALQSLSFKTVVSPEARDLLILRIKTIEGLMFQHAKKNPGYLSMIAAIPEYPIFYNPEMPLQDLMMMMSQGNPAMAQPQGQPGLDSKGIKNIPEQQGAPDVTKPS
jgi:hypothetical protein